MVPPIGVQLYTVREALSADMAGTLTRIADMGYVLAEPYAGIDANAAAPIIKDLGLTVLSFHAPLPVGDARATVLAMAAAYGARIIVNPMQPAEDFTTREGVLAVADRLNAAAAGIAAEGYQLAYHNHWWEFVTVDGRTAYDILRENLADEVLLQLDTYWAAVAGQDAPALLQDLGARCPIPHIKDGPGTQDGLHQALGSGQMPIAALMQAGGTHMQALIAELDYCATNMLEAVQQSYTYMTGEGFAHGR